MRISQVITYCLSMPKTLYFNVRCLPFQEAVRLPIFVSYKVRCLNLKKHVIEIQSDEVMRFMIKIGFNGTDEVASKKSLINLEDGKIVFKGNCAISEGCTIGVSNGGKIEFGRNFSANKNFFISCNQHTILGNDTMLGWDVTFFDANGHPILKNGIEKPPFKPIYVGNHVWICAQAHILKGTVIPDGSIIAYGSLVSTKLNEKNALYGGTPVKLLQTDITWKR